MTEEEGAGGCSTPFRSRDPSTGFRQRWIVSPPLAGEAPHPQGRRPAGRPYGRRGASPPRGWVHAPPMADCHLRALTGAGRAGGKGKIPAPDSSRGIGMTEEERVGGGPTHTFRSVDPSTSFRLSSSATQGRRPAGRPYGRRGPSPAPGMDSRSANGGLLARRIFDIFNRLGGVEWRGRGGCHTFGDGGDGLAKRPHIPGKATSRSPLRKEGGPVLWGWIHAPPMVDCQHGARPGAPTTLAARSGSGMTEGSGGMTGGGVAGVTGRWFVDAGMGGWVSCRQEEGLHLETRQPRRLAWASSIFS